MPERGGRAQGWRGLLNKKRPPGEGGRRADWGSADGLWKNTARDGGTAQERRMTGRLGWSGRVGGYELCVTRR